MLHNKTNSFRWGVFLVLLAAILPGVAGARAVPIPINYQAKLTGTGGTPLSGVHTLYFSIYQGGDSSTAGSGTLVFSESASVTAVDGVVSHEIGKGVNIYGTVLSASMFDTSQIMYLQVCIDSVGNVVLPRTQLDHVPFAFKSRETDNAIRKQASTYIVADVTDSPTTNAQNLVAAYLKAKLLMPNGQALSATNRAVLFVPPGQYDLGGGQLLLNSEYVDVIGMSGKREDQHIVGTADIQGVVRQTANNVGIENLYVSCTRDTGSLFGFDTDPAAYYPESGTTDTVIRNCRFESNDTNAWAMRIRIEYLGTYERCAGGQNSLGGFGGTASGTFTDCTCAYGAFGGSGAAAPGTASGTFTRCTGGSMSFAGGGTANGIFRDCVGGPYAFAGNYGTAIGTFTNCTAEFESFGGAGGASGTFTNCTGGSNAFGGQMGLADGAFTNCTGGDYSFGGGLGIASGVFNSCTGGSYAFAGTGGNASGGKFFHCTGGSNSFTTLGSPTVVYCVRNNVAYP
jgi:hypothetical protein